MHQGKKPARGWGQKLTGFSTFILDYATISSVYFLMWIDFHCVAMWKWWGLKNYLFSIWDDNFSSPAQQCFLSSEERWVIFFGFFLLTIILFTVVIPTSLIKSKCIDWWVFLDLLFSFTHRCYLIKTLAHTGWPWKYICCYIDKFKGALTTGSDVCVILKHDYPLLPLPHCPAFTVLIAHLQLYWLWHI